MKIKQLFVSKRKLLITNLTFLLVLTNLELILCFENSSCSSCQTIRTKQSTSKDPKEHFYKSHPELEHFQTLYGEQFSKSPISHDADLQKMAAVRKAFRHAWKGYCLHAWGNDQLLPVNNGSYNWLDLGTTIVDNLDTLLLMGFNQEFEHAVSWVENGLNFRSDRNTSVFEATIRVVAGLLSSYHISKKPLLLDKAKELANKISKSWDEQSGFPMPYLNFKTNKKSLPTWNNNHYVLADLGTLQMEFSYLTKLTGDPQYRQMTFEILNKLFKQYGKSGFFPIFIHPNASIKRLNDLYNKKFSIGGMGDSFFEYLLKVWVLEDQKSDDLIKMFDRAMNNIIMQMVHEVSIDRASFKNNNLKKRKYRDGHKFQKPQNVSHKKKMKTIKKKIKKQTITINSEKKLKFIGEIENGKLIFKMEEITCFVPGLFALAAKLKVGNYSRYGRLSKDLLNTCYYLYTSTRTKLAPELISFQNDQIIILDANYRLRPETIESLFYLWRLTGDPIYRKMGWRIFKSIEKYCKTSSGYSSLLDVNDRKSNFRNEMQSYFLSETLKYLYLLFAPSSILPLDSFVFNTEGHPFPIQK
ncbi:mannosyl-oligosaccharide alpha-12-mannosidase-related [Anaeramoeba flamelloides]|uniref:alpha-1,2-Mannosidase n=1 Tax=Anaeramoeba flamelloides TaxID=1746091 RepID=A0AAV8A5K3_9EUKA|nr:mannosyl-oligosaccharide alpha-12-mannosidase-related [Anaeramoeba flamelloides]